MFSQTFVDVDLSVWVTRTLRLLVNVFMSGEERGEQMKKFVESCYETIRGQIEESS